MDAVKFKNEIVAALRATRVSMLSIGWQRAMMAADLDMQHRAANQLVEVQRAILALENARMKFLEEFLSEYEVQLTEKINNVTTESQNAEAGYDADKLLEEVGQLLKTLERVLIA